MATPDFIETFAQQCLTSPLLADLPLLFTAGQTVYHRQLGICTVLESAGARRRLISYRRINYQADDEATDSVWVDIDVLEDMEMRTQQDLLSLSPDELDMSPDRDAH